jgi:hypothetical protein
MSEHRSGSRTATLQLHPRGTIVAALAALLLAGLAPGPALASPLLEPLTAGALTLTPEQAVLGATGQAFTISALGAPYAAGLYPECEPCSPGAMVRLSVGWVDNIDMIVVYDFDQGPPAIPGPDSGPTLVVAAGSVVLPGPGSSFVASVPFTLTVIEDPTEYPPSAGLVASGWGTARARFAGDADGWHLVDVVYTLAVPDARPGRPGHHARPRR